MVAMLLALFDCDGGACRIAINMMRCHLSGVDIDAAHDNGAIRRQ